MGFCDKTLHGVKPLNFFASLLFISSVLNMWTGTEGWSYHHSDVTMNWEKAREWCRAKFTDLVAIQNKEEISHLNSVLPKVTGYYWIGIRKMNKTWTWVGTNKILTDEAENWARKEPNGKKNNEDCVEIYIKRQSDAGKWNDESCSKKKTALCYTASCKEDSCVSGHGECVEMINSLKCSCFEGFYGERCENVIKCKSEDVTTPDYGSVQCSNPNGNFSYDSQCEYFCEAGFKLQGGSRMMRCTATTEWSSKPPSCDLVQCSELIKPQNGTMDCHHDSKGKYCYKSTCEFACQEGYTLGTSSSSALFCEATGQWSDSQPSCEVIKCKPEDITAPGHGSVRCSSPNGNVSFDSVCEYTCEEGYELKGSVTTRCEATAEWTNKPPTCEPVQCSELIKPNNGTMDCHHDSRGTFSHQTTCEFACQEGYTLGTSSSSTLFCEATGQWNDSQPSCEVIKCKQEDITAPGHGSVRCSYPNGNLSFDSVCEYTCKEGYELKGSVTTRCDATAEWTNKPPTCEPVQCSELIKPNNGAMDCHHDSKGRYCYKSTCEFECQEGYTLRTSSSSTLFCEATGQWNDSQPSCEVIKCKQEDITAPGHGSVRCSNPNGNVSFDSVCEYTCEEGYELKGSVKTRCEATAEWTNKPPTCEPVQCSELIKPNNGTMDCHHDSKGKYCYKSTCEFACQEGYTLGTSSSSTLFCEARGHWNDSQPSCEVIKCKAEDITAPGHGSVRCSNPNGNLSFDSVCEFTCEEGYELRGSVKTRCEATAEWTNKPPTCEPVQCSELIKPNNGTMDCHHDSKGKYSYKSTCEFACQEGYTLGTSSSSTLFCEATGQWNDSKPSCEVIICKPEDITAPGHGSVRCSNPNGNLSFDSVCEYTCEEGYELRGSVKTRCDATAEWTNKPPTCEPVQCSELIKPNNGTMDCHHNSKGKYSYKSTCEFACQEGYMLGTSSSSTLFCEARGHWNDSQPSCEVIKCMAEDITAPGHGSVTCSNPNGNLSFDSVCEYTCEEGYELRGSVKTRCEATAEWTNKPPTCEPVCCPVLEIPANGLLACNDFSSFSYGNQCSFSCEEGYRLQGASEISCTKTAEWSHEPPRCEAVECLQLHEPVNGHMNCTSLEPTFGTICIFSCHDGFQIQSNEMLMCNHNGNWSGEVTLCQVQPGPSVAAFKAAEVTLGVAATVGSSSLLLALWILRKLKKKANMFDLTSKSEIGDPPQVYKSSLDSLI